MNERKKKLIDIIQEIDEQEKKTKNKRGEVNGLSNDVAEIENLLILEGLLKQDQEKNLTKAEREKLMDACLQMRTDATQTIDVCMSLNAFFISLLSLIVSITVTVITLVKDVGGPIFVKGFVFFATIIIVGIIVILCSAKKMSIKNARRADRYRNAYITLLFTQDENEE